MRRFLAIFALLAGPPAVAQEAAAPTPADDAQPPLAEIEHGPWLRAVAGPIAFFNTPGAGGGFSAGAAMGLEVGYDFSDSVQGGVLFAGGFHSAAATYKGAGGSARGDFETRLAAATLRLVLGAVDDGQVPRTQFYLRAGGGLLSASPAGVLAASAPALLVGPGVEYHTRLRRFALAAGLDGIGAKAGGSFLFGAALTASLRYTF